MALIVLSSIMMSFGGLIVRSIENADAWQINLYRALGLASAALVILMLRYRGRVSAPIRAAGRSAAVGGALLAVAGIAYLQAMTHTTIANTLFILSAIPFFTAAMARVFLNERLKKSTLAAMSVACAGILIMLAEGLGIGSWYGNLMALTTAFLFSSYTVIVRRKQNTDMLPTVLLSALLITTVSLLVRLGNLGISGHDLFLCLLWGGGIAGLANAMFVMAIRHLAAAEITLLMLLEFALGPIWVWWFVGEVPSSWALAGGVLVISSVAVRALIELPGTRRG